MQFDAEMGVDPDDEEKDVYPSREPSKLTRALSRTISRASSTSNPGPPPDGGLRAWTQVAMAHFVVASAWGFVTSWGVFQTYYTAHLPQSQSTISWIGSIQVTLLFLVGIGSGRAFDAGYFHASFRTGALLQILGVFTASASTTFYQLLLAQGFAFGIGAGLVFTPTMALLSTYFAKKRSLAIGIAASGSCTGGLVFPALVRQLLPQFGFPWTMRVVGFFIVAFNLLAAIFFRIRLPPRQSGPLVEWSAFKEGPYAFFVFGMFFVFWALYFAFYYVGIYARTIIGFDYDESINILLVMVGVGVPGRLIPNYLADRKAGPLNMMIPGAVVCGIMFFGWIGVNSPGSLYAFGSIYGIGSGAIQSLFPASLSSLTTDLKMAGTRLGMGFFVVSFATLSGPPIAGALITHADGSFLYAQIWAGCSMIIGVCLLTAARIAKTRWILKARV